MKQNVCPNGHKPPIVQHLKREGVYVCTRCALQWTSVIRPRCFHGVRHLAAKQRNRKGPYHVDEVTP